MVEDARYQRKSEVMLRDWWFMNVCEHQILQAKRTKAIYVSPAFVILLVSHKASPFA